MHDNAISGSGASGSTSGAGDRLATTDPKSVVRQHGGPVVGDGSSNDTTFYITLTIEQDDDDDDPLERIDNSGKKYSSVPNKRGGTLIYFETIIRSTFISQGSILSRVV